MKKILFFGVILFSFFQCKERELDKYSIGIFGGSQSLSSNSDPVKEKWSKIFNVSITNCGVVGAGFSMIKDNNIPNQIKNNIPFDIYIIWCSTNDSGLNDLLDDESDVNTQSGGLKKSVDLIKKKNPNALILLFTSIWVPLENMQNRIPVLVQQQVDFCRKYKIPCLNQYENNILKKEDFSNDKIHSFSPTLYWKLEPNQTEFLQKHIQ